MTVFPIYKIDEKGYVISGKDTAEFLEKKLAELGLNRKEANDFIVYWLPRMQQNSYNLITFQEERTGFTVVEWGGTEIK